MNRSKFSEEQIITILKEHEAGARLADLCHKYGMSEATIYNWKAKYGSHEEVKRLKNLEEENAKLKNILANLMLDNAALKDLLKK
jgi:putative transposase